jgi:hypothetical protein
VLAVQEKLEAFLAILQYKPPDGWWSRCKLSFFDIFTWLSCLTLIWWNCCSCNKKWTRLPPTLSFDS